MGLLSYSWTLLSHLFVFTDFSSPSMIRRRSEEIPKGTTRVIGVSECKKTGTVPTRPITPHQTLGDPPSPLDPPCRDIVNWDPIVLPTRTYSLSSGPSTRPDHIGVVERGGRLDSQADTDTVYVESPVGERTGYRTGGESDQRKYLTKLFIHTYGQEGADREELGKY